jgi:GT2 family glycosyltransferase
LHNFLVEDEAWIKAIQNIDGAESRESLERLPPGPTLVRRIRASVPRAWVPVALRGFSGATAHLPANLRYRLHRALGLLRPDMGEIERDYAAWIALYDRIDADARRGIVAEITRMSAPPLISVLMPVFNPSPDHLRAAIHSVRDQLYPWWELCIGDDASTDPAVVDILRDAAERDHRIKLVRREQNGHISAASNTALQVATGPFVALFDHDDVLPPHALYEVATKIAAHPDVDIIYSDEDHIDDEGRRSHPYFKPDWNGDLMLGQNLVSHLGVYRKSLIEDVGGFRIGLEGSQDYDLALRLVARTRPERIVHIAKVLYHWRQGAADLTFSEASHDRCVDNGRRAIHEFVTQDYPGALVEAARFVPGWTRIVYPIPEPAPLVSVIVSGDCADRALFSCFDGVLNRTDYPALEILIAVDGSRSLPEVVTDDKRVRVITGRSVRANQAAEQARGSLLLMLSPNLVPRHAGWLREMVSQAVRPDVGAVGAKLLCHEGTVRHAGIALGGRSLAFTPLVGPQRSQPGYFGHLQLTRDVSAVSGMCLMVAREAFLDVGGLDPVLAAAGLSDVDLCLKLAKSGYRTVWTPYAELMLREGAPLQTILAPQFKRAAARMRQRWGSELESDRYWNLNLSTDPAEVGLAFPPRTGRSIADLGELSAFHQLGSQEPNKIEVTDSVATAG